MPRAEIKNTDFLTFTVKDGAEGQADINVRGSDDFPVESLLGDVGGIYLNFLQSGNVDERLTVDQTIDGEAMIIITPDDGDGLSFQMVMNPTVTIHSGDMSPAQGLAFSALNELEHTLGSSACELTSVTQG